jgi:hypothetical protein
LGTTELPEGQLTDTERHLLTRRYDLKLWIHDRYEGATYLPR